MSRLVFRRDLPRRLPIPDGGTRPHRFLMVFDRRLAGESEVSGWLERFPLRVPVTAGEKLKSIARFPESMRRLLRLVPDATSRNTTLVGIGGGSVGDFTGFAASVLKRGVGLIHIPSTWLAAIDSAHGGKTALNVDGVKNQVGSFYPAHAVITARTLLETLSRRDTVSGLGELIKIAVIHGDGLFDSLSRSSTDGTDGAVGTVDRALMWRLLPEAVEAKMRVVERDPREQTGARRVLNLGHSLGHALEAHHGIAHGIAVGLGLRFSVDWGLRRGGIPEDEARRVLRLLDSVKEFRRTSLRGAKLTRSRLAALLARDKKAAQSGSLHFVFVRRVGRVETEPVRLQSVVSEAARQGWIG